MEITKNDLSHARVKLDYQAIEKGAEIGYYNQLKSIESDMIEGS